MGMSEKRPLMIPRAWIQAAAIVAVSLTLLVLASLILVVELLRTGGLYPRIVLASTLTLFCTIIQHLSSEVLSEHPTLPVVPKCEPVFRCNRSIGPMADG